MEGRRILTYIHEFMNYIAMTKPLLLFMDKIKVCPKCEGEMKSGNLTGQEIDWKKEGDRSFLRDEGRKIFTYACEKCGYMESYVRK